MTFVKYFPTKRIKEAKLRKIVELFGELVKKTKCHIFKAVFFRDFLEVVRYFTH